MINLREKSQEVSQNRVPVGTLEVYVEHKQKTGGPFQGYVGTIFEDFLIVSFVSNPKP